MPRGDIQVVELPESNTASEWKVAAGFAGSLAAIILSVALWQVSAYVGIALLCVGVGVGIKQTCQGLALLVLYRSRGQAELARAIGESKAKMIAARSGVVTIDQPREWRE